MARKNYSKMSTNPEVVPTPVASIDETETTVTSPEETEIPVAQPPVLGVVARCGKLNVRKAPDLSAEILCEALLKSELTIDLDKSTDEWYSVCTSAGIEGFCMKKFVDLK